MLSRHIALCYRSARSKLKTSGMKRWPEHRVPAPRRGPATPATPLIRSARAADAWPTRPVQVMVPYPPAGGADTTARILYNKVGNLLGQQFVIENLCGAGRTIRETPVGQQAPGG